MVILAPVIARCKPSWQGPRRLYITLTRCLGIRLSIVLSIKPWLGVGYLRDRLVIMP